jgi:hypothetical protein
MKLLRKFFSDLYLSFNEWLTGVWSKMNYRSAKTEAIRLCEQYNRKYYVIQSSLVHWQVFSTADVRSMKKKGIFKKDLTWKEMTEKSAFVAYPKK